MRKILTFFIGVSAMQYGMHGDFGLYSLENLFSCHQGRAEYWPTFYEKTSKTVCKVLKSNVLLLRNDEVIALWAFLINTRSMENFVNSIYFIEDVHGPWLINLFKVSYKVAAAYNKEFTLPKRYIDTLNKVGSIKDLCKDDNFKISNKAAAQILDSVTFWGE